MGKSQRDKGARFEREIVNTAKEHSLNALRVPLSGAAEGFKDDVLIRVNDSEWRIEAKKRGGGFKQIYQWKGDADVLVIGADRKRPLAVLDMEDFFWLLKQQVDTL
jgi:Holliday junction resolvase